MSMVKTLPSHYAFMSSKKEKSMTNMNIHSLTALSLIPSLYTNLVGTLKNQN